MKTRTMSPKLFARSKVGSDPSAFLNKYLAWLRTFGFVAPILEAYQEGTIDPLPAIGALREALLTHEIRMQIAKAQESMKQAVAKIGSAPRYDITLYCKFFNETTQQWDIKIGTQTKKRFFEDEKGMMTWVEEEHDLIFTSHMFQSAQRLCALRLSRREDAMFGEIVNRFDRPIITRITRDMALGMLFPSDKHPMMKRVAKHESIPFKNYQRAHNDRANFSRG